jgi:chromosome segregation ATPase
MRSTIERIENEQRMKREFLSELGQAALSYVTVSQFERLNEEVARNDDALKTERGKITITEAELEAVERRLRDLEELKRELEVSNMEASKELELLRTQQRDIAAENDRLRQQLHSSLEKLDVLLLELSNSQKMVDRLTGTKSEILQIEQKSEHYAEQIAMVNNKYVELKQAYDALDIEYAQLYERHQSAGL